MAAAVLDVEARRQQVGDVERAGAERDHLPVDRRHRHLAAATVEEQVVGAEVAVLDRRRAAAARVVRREPRREPLDDRRARARLSASPKRVEEPVEQRGEELGDAGGVGVVRRAGESPGRSTSSPQCGACSPASSTSASSARSTDSPSSWSATAGGREALQEQQEPPGRLVVGGVVARRACGSRPSGRRRRRSGPRARRAASAAAVARLTGSSDGPLATTATGPSAPSTVSTSSTHEATWPAPTARRATSSTVAPPVTSLSPQQLGEPAWIELVDCQDHAAPPGAHATNVATAPCSAGSVGGRVRVREECDACRASSRPTSRARATPRSSSSRSSARCASPSPRSSPSGSPARCARRRSSSGPAARSTSCSCGR